MAVGVGVVRQCAVMCLREVALERDFFQFDTFNLQLSLGGFYKNTNLSFVTTVLSWVPTAVCEVLFFHYADECSVICCQARGASLPLTRCDDCSGNRTTSCSSFPVSWRFTNHGFLMKTSVIKSFELTIQLNTYKKRSSYRELQTTKSTLANHNGIKIYNISWLNDIAAAYTTVCNDYYYHYKCSIM